MKDKLAQIATDYEITLNDSMLNDFAHYADLLTQWNERMNLTAITDPLEISCKHFLDSLLLLKAVEIKEGASLIDVGTGAGFPAVPVKIVRPDLQITLLDSLAKRVRFLEALSEALRQDNRIIHGRAEELGRSPEYREQYDVATARAVASLPVLSEYCLPFVRKAGAFLALKGGDVEEEARLSAHALKTLGAGACKRVPFTLPDGSGRTILVIEKISQTPPKYPRTYGKMSKAPL